MRRLRLVVGVAGLVLAGMLLGALAPIVAVAALGILGALFSQQAFSALRCLPGKACLGWARPPGPYRYVHSVASTVQGVGGELLRALGDEADGKGWWLVIEASNERLARYYEAFGFAQLGLPVPMPDGSRRVRMWRPPAEEA